MISIVPKEKKENGNESNQGAGRPKNPTFPLDPSNPLHDTHEQRLRSKFLVPILAGKPPPRHPGSRKNTSTWRKQANRFAAYVLILFDPWDLTTKKPATQLNWNSFETWYRDISSPDQT
eukprot:Lithocolla_globosa_v1_NODE_515_length_3843_cov_39.657075.p4 type:complete len:119 gc:universal NODE_515_length_3843_cov_39.657075:3607-3251(-)